VRDQDFTSLDLQDVTGKVLKFAKLNSKADAVHWISAHGLSKIVASTGETWQWAFASVDVVGKHVVSLSDKGEPELFAVWQLWRQAVELFPFPWNSKMTPKTLSRGHHEGVIWPVFNGAELVGALAFQGLPEDGCPAKTTAALQKGIALATRYLTFACQLLEAKNQSYIDELTGLYNQRHLPMVLSHEVERCRRENGHFSLLFMDIDYFKMVNDGKGHWVGSKLLGELAKVLLTQIRTCDHAFRYGGDEFIVMLGGAGVEVAARVAERIRKAVESHSFLVDGHDLKLTVSIGLASYPDHAQSAEGLIQIADQAMYHGKRKSRNIVFTAS
jgi:diguanylate cyclase (GGDEF)-like protein